MTLTVTHTFVSAIPDDADATLVRPSNWNDVHTITGTVGNASLDDMAANTIKGRLSTTGAPQDLTGTQTTTLIDTFTSTLKGLAPSSGGGAVNFLRADGTWAAPAGSGVVSDGDKGDITVSGTGTVWTIDAGTVTLAKMASMATASFLGRNTAGTGAPEVLSIATSKTMLGLTGTNSGDQTITLTGDVTGTGVGSFAATIAADAVTYAKMQNVSATSRFIGRITSGSGDPEELTGTQATTLLDAFTTSLKGLAPSSGGGTTNFLRADGTWNAPPSGGTPAGASLTIQYNNASAFGGMSGTSWDDTNRSLTMTGATVTTSNPVLNMTQTWNAGAVAFSGLKLNITNTASAALSRAIDIQFGGNPVLTLSTTAASTSTDTALIVNNRSAVQSIASLNYTLLSANSYFTGSAFVALNTGLGSNLVLRDTGFFYYQSPSVSAGAAQSPVERFSYTIATSTFSCGTVLQVNTNAVLTSPAAATLQFGAADAATAIAQTTQVQSVVAGTSNTAGADWSIQGSRGTGTGIGGDIVFKAAAAGTTGTAQNAATEVLRVKNTGGIGVIAPYSNTVPMVGVGIAGSLYGIGVPTSTVELGLYTGGALKVTIQTGIKIWSNNTFQFSSGADATSAADVFIGRGGAAATLQFGAADAAAAVAQTTQVQSVSAGTSGVAGALWTFQGSRSTGTAAGGDIAFFLSPNPGIAAATTQNTAVEHIRLQATGRIKFTNAAHFSANGSVATVLGSLGPTGSHAAVQKWLTIVDNGAVVGYIPVF